MESYFAIRALEIKKVGNYPRLCLNGKPYFFHGLLDQGYWPDGIFTPATPQCYADDILMMKKLGFNTLRKHIKVEPEEFYYRCDKLGMIVFQDMVNNGDYNFLRDTALPTVGIQKLDDRKLHADEVSRRRFLEGMEATVKQLKNHPCICYWTIFNEGWGQFDSDKVYEQFRTLYSEMKADKDFERLMTEKILSSEELKATVSKILEGGNTYLISFLMTLIDRNRMDEVMDMFLDFERGYKEKKNILEAEAVTAIEMTEDQIEQVKKELGEKYGKTIVLKTSVDPSIIGGMVLYVGNEMLDASVKAKFEGLKKQLKSIQI